MSDRMKKNISFKKHEKDLYDFINDKEQVPDASAFIKGLIRDYMNSIKPVEIVEQPIQQTNVSQEELQKAINDMVYSIRDMFKSRPNHFAYGDFMEEIEKGIVLEKNDPKDDIIRHNVTHNESNITYLQDLDI